MHSLVFESLQSHYKDIINGNLVDGCTTSIANQVIQAIMNMIT